MNLDPRLSDRRGQPSIHPYGVHGGDGNSLDADFEYRDNSNDVANRESCLRVTWTGNCANMFLINGITPFYKEFASSRDGLMIYNFRFQNGYYMPPRFISSLLLPKHSRIAYCTLVAIFVAAGDRHSHIITRSEVPLISHIFVSSPAHKQFVHSFTHLVVVGCSLM